jgi:hypothetical protein
LHWPLLLVVFNWGNYVEVWGEMGYRKLNWKFAFSGTV